MTRTIKKIGAWGGVALCGALAATNPAAAQGMDVLWACYQPNSGLIYRVNPPDAPGQDPALKDGCTSPNHTLFSWNAVGPPGPQGEPGEDGVLGYSTHFTLGFFDSTSPKTVEASCPPDKVVLGGGANVSPEFDIPPVAITRSFGLTNPIEGEPRWVATAQEITPIETSWRLVAIVHCADAGNVDAVSLRPSADDAATLSPVAERVEVGDVLVLDPDRPGLLRLSRRVADTSVFGVVGADAGLIRGAVPPSGATDDAEILQEQTGTLAHEPEAMTRSVEVPVAVSGPALCKVDADYGSVRPGDLLTTSPTPGHAMRSDDPRAGTILGKALEPLDTGAGLIRVLVMLR